MRLRRGTAPKPVDSPEPFDRIRDVPDCRAHDLTRVTDGLAMGRVRRVRVRGGREFEYVSQGNGPATLLVHPGGPGFTYHYLRGFLRLANSHLRVILFNPRGVGHSWR